MKPRLYRTADGTALAAYDRGHRRWAIEALPARWGDESDAVGIYAHTDPSYFRGRHWRANHRDGRAFDIEEFPSLRAVAERAIEVAKNRRDFRLLVG